MEDYYLIDLERSIKTGVVFYWNPNKRGYTHNVFEAGKYEPWVAEKIVNEDIDKHTVMVPESVVKKLLGERV